MVYMRSVIDRFAVYLRYDHYTISEYLLGCFDQSIKRATGVTFNNSMAMSTLSDGVRAEMRNINGVML